MISYCANMMKLLTPFLTMQRIVELGSQGEFSRIFKRSVLEKSLGLINDEWMLVRLNKLDMIWIQDHSLKHVCMYPCTSVNYNLKSAKAAVAHIYNWGLFNTRLFLPQYSDTTNFTTSWILRCIQTQQISQLHEFFDVLWNLCSILC